MSSQRSTELYILFTGDATGDALNNTRVQGKTLAYPILLEAITELGMPELL